jgi:hypothetical protein
MGYLLKTLGPEKYCNKFSLNHLAWMDEVLSQLLRCNQDILPADLVESG